MSAGLGSTKCVRSITMRHMSTARRYSAGTVRALFALSRDRCYEPLCQEKTVRNIDGMYQVAVEVAHICAVKPEGERYDSSMSDLQRNRYSNLILLCVAHHKTIDSPGAAATYTVALLRKWKSQRETSINKIYDVNLNDLNELEQLTGEHLQDMISTSIERTRNDVLTAIDGISDQNQQVAGTLRLLVEETWSRSYLDSDAVNTLAHAAWTLGALEGEISYFAGAVTTLSSLEGEIASFAYAADHLKTMDVNMSSLSSAAGTIRQANNDAAELLDTARQTMAAVIEARKAVQFEGVARASIGTTAPRQIHPAFGGSEHWKWFAAGCVTAYALPAALLILWINR